MGEQNTTIKELAGRVPIQAYLSYRHCEETKQARDLLKKHCEAYKIELIYDEEQLKIGDSITAFMDEIASAQCIFIFLTETYFDSAFTLYELIKINECRRDRKTNKPFIVPIKISKSIHGFSASDAKNGHWLGDKNQKCRDDLTEKLGSQVEDHDQAWQRIAEAFPEMLNPFLDKIYPSVEEDASVLETRVNNVYAEIATVIQKSKDKLTQDIKAKITRLLNNRKPIFLNQLSSDLGFASSDNETIARYLAENGDVKGTIKIMTQTLKKQREVLRSVNLEKWRESHAIAEQLCGWLLIKTIDPVWWFNHEFKASKIGKTFASDIFLEERAFVEIIISRDLFQPAKYKRLAETGKVQPFTDNLSIDFIFDANVGALEESFLINLYRDLFKSTGAEGTTAQLKEDIKVQLDTIITEDRKCIYYVTNEATMMSLKSIQGIEEWLQQLEGKLRFIYLPISDEKVLKQAQSPYPEQKALLFQIADLLKIRDEMI